MASTVTEIREDNALVEKVIRILTQANESLEFIPGGVPVKIAAAVYGKAPCFVQEGIRAGWLPIGHIMPGNQRDNFYISPRKLYEDTGFMYTGQSVEEIEEKKRMIKERR